MTKMLDQSNQAARDENLWNANDVAAFLKTSRSWVYKQVEAGVLPCLRIGALLRFDPAAVRAFARGEPARDARVVPLGGRRRD